ncbi:MAG TPA: hypothetical protein VEV17_08085 [Bryobacteraceae bacterium]|nr:hypothetical protein [Bryobacteraceae bacterium]
MPAIDHLVGVKSFLNHNSLPARIALMVLAVAALAQAVTFNPPTPSIDTHDGNCTFGGSLAGAATNGGAGVTLSGNGSMQGFGLNGGVCRITLNWPGTGSGAFPGATATVTSIFTLNVPADVSVSTCLLTVFINGIQETQINCPTGSGGAFGLAPQSFPVPASLNSYLVQLDIVAQWSDTVHTVFSVSVPGPTSIDILAQAGLPSGPAPPTLVLTLTGILLLSLVGFGILRRQSAGGFPGSHP